MAKTPRRRRDALTLVSRADTLDAPYGRREPRNARLRGFKDFQLVVKSNDRWFLGR